MGLFFRKKQRQPADARKIGPSDMKAHEGEIVKIQAFVRGCLCRARVTKMVTRLIDEMLAKKGQTREEEVGDVVAEADFETEDEEEYDEYSVESMEPLEETGPIGDVDQEGPSQSQPQPQPQPPMPRRGSSGPYNYRDAMQNMQGSVRNMSGIFQDPNSPAPPRNWTPKKEKDKLAFLKAAAPPLTNTEVSPSQTPKATLKNVQLKSNATKHVLSSDELLKEQEVRLNEEIERLLQDIKRIGEPGQPYVNFGDLFDDDEVANYYEALVGTLKAAKKKKLISYEGQILLKGVNDAVEIRII